MAAFIEDQDRNVIPRWRDFRTTVELGELGSGKTEIKPNRLAHDLTWLTRDWQENKTASFAGDLISAGMVSGNLEAAREASEFVVSLGEGASTQLRALALRVLAGGQPLITPPSQLDLNLEAVTQPSAEIAFTRRRLVQHPSDAVLWMDLAYLYAIRGLSTKSERAVRIALNLAPSNRFILRSAARFFIHRDRVDTAHELIRRSPGFRADPWLVSAEIAIALAAERTPWATKEALTLLNSGNFPSHHLTELSSALGTLEFNAGNARKAKKFFKTSLIAPNDNSLAQAKWISRSMSGLWIDSGSDRLQIARPFEADAYEAFGKGDWRKAFNSTMQWLGDQPFSSRPAHLGGYIASSLLEDFTVAEEVAKFGQVVNPTDPAFNIALAYCYASSGRLEESALELAKVPTLGNEQWVEAAVDANQGLIAFRRGDAEMGRKFYAEAVRKADRDEDKRIKTIALLNWCAEEVGLSDSNSHLLLNDAKESSKKGYGADLTFLVGRLEERIAKAFGPSAAR
jgi:Flp pilus assembly protein TadD